MGLKFVVCIVYLSRSLAMQTIEPLMFSQGLDHRDILSHTLMLLSELFDVVILVGFQAKNVM